MRVDLRKASCLGGNSGNRGDEMSWYAVSTLFKSFHRIAIGESIWEERIFLANAGSPEEAEKIISRQAISDNLTYPVDSKEGGLSNDEVTWKFQAITSTFEILDDELISGTEIFSRHLKDEEAQSLFTKFD